MKMETIHDKFKLNIYCQTLKLIHIPIKYKPINFNIKELYENESKTGYGYKSVYGDGDEYGLGDGNGSGKGSGWIMIII